MKHEEEVTLAIAQGELVLRILGVDILQLELRGGENAGDAIELLLRCAGGGLSGLQFLTRGVDLGLGDRGLLRDGEDEDEDDGAEAAANAIEEREAEHLGLAALVSE